MKKAAEWQDEAQAKCENECYFLDEHPCKTHQIWGIRQAQAEAMLAMAGGIFRRVKHGEYDILSAVAEIEAIAKEIRRGK